MSIRVPQLTPLLTDQRRGLDRRKVARDSTLRTHPQLPIDVLVCDLSQTGFSFLYNGPIALDAPVNIGLPGIGSAAARVVRRQGDTYGCEFDVPLRVHDVAAAFGYNPVVQFPLSVSANDHTASAEPAASKWPRAYRAGFIVGTTSLLWSLIYLAARPFL
jgi:hypothetical protein